MKLFCIHTCVVKGGKVVDAGQTYDTGDIAKKEDREAYELIAAGRMVQAGDTKAVEEAKVQIAREEETKAAKKGKEKDSENDGKGKK